MVSTAHNIMRSTCTRSILNNERKSFGNRLFRAAGAHRIRKYTRCYSIATYQPLSNCFVSFPAATSVSVLASWIRIYKHFFYVGLDVCADEYRFVGCWFSSFFYRSHALVMASSVREVDQWPAVEIVIARHPCPTISACARWKKDISWAATSVKELGHSV